ncbi:hypothetical protein [Falsibacillus albus]|uniref:Lipoprotein n=1 Tax=Falsibacillus albus TaxID=2478915 RepID=A0A3L7JT69_9BACI|nr:hypothetical protein [Falsibacillus albus]RLQ93690.1 hypothetical protein D9X91_17060 [Falsibacillus albus]
MLDSKKRWILICLFTAILVVLSSCESAENHSSANGQSNSDGSKYQSNQSANSSTSLNSKSEENDEDTRTDAVMNAVLTYESTKDQTLVDYKTKTMVQDGQKVGFEIVPASNHQNDFKEGLIKEMINNEDESHSVTLFQFIVDEHNHVSLIDPATTKVVFSK